MMPQVLNGRTMAKTNEDVDPRPAPMSEEEETKHSNAIHFAFRGQVALVAIDRTDAVVRPDDKPLCGDRGEVPHPPPWVR